ncbi:YraN family protein [Microgenomates group bacterium RIFCSPLOWO2_01_FULL_47_10]|nr:MAG: YraN family protein [Microgenomates group bacterium RIFCSPLOWO2_01_FULL_47_10]
MKLSLPQSPLPLGSRGENQARKLLKAKGYRFITQNFRCLIGEIDLVFQDGKQLVFVEVKTRTTDVRGHPEEAVTPHKIHKITQVGEYFLKTHPDLPHFARIDVVAIEGKILTHFQNITQ